METARAAIRERLDPEFDVRNCEAWPARPVRPWEACEEEVLSSDLLVLILGNRYGARCPEKPTVSYTEAEYRTALQAGDPQIVAYVATGLPGPAPPDSEEDAAKLDLLRQEVRDELFAPEVDVADLPARVHEAVVDIVRREGLSGETSTFQRWEVRYRGELEGAGLFHHRHALVSRDDPLAELEDFISSRDQVGVLVGAAGLGKTRLLIEAARLHSERKGQPPIRFLAASPHPVTPEALVQLPKDEVIVVVDDAQSRGSLGADIETLLSRRNNGIRILLATRPEGEEFVRSALRSLAAQWVPPLAPLEGDGVSLAVSLLGSDRREEARRIADLSSGNPLFVTVGSELLKEGKLVLADVPSHADFRAVVFDRVLRGAGAPPSDSETKVLDVVSAIAPIRADAEAAVLIAKVGGIERKVAAEGLSRAIERGIILNRGGLYAIAPDLLSDDVLRRACVTTVGIATGFLDGLDLSDADSEALANAVRNALIVEYLQRLAGQPVDLLDRLWDRLARRLEQADASGVRAAVDRLTPVARVAPGPLIEMVQGLLPRVLTPDVAYPFSGLRTSVVQLLIQCGQDPERSNEAARALCTLASPELDNAASGRREACSALEQLASYGNPPAYGRQEGVVSAVLDAYRSGSLVGDVVPAVLAKALDREGEWTESDGDTLRMGAFPVSPDVTRGVRESARAGLREVAGGTAPSLAARAVDALAHLLGHWPGKFGRSAGPDERAGWSPEASIALASLADLATRAPLATTRAIARRRIQEHRRRGHSLVEIQRLTELASCVASLDVRVIDSVLEPVDDGIEGDKPWEQARQRHIRSCRWLARALVRAHETPAALVEYLHPITEQVAAMGVRESHVGVWTLAGALGRVRPDWRLPIHDEICRVGGSFLAGGIQQVYVAFMEEGEKSCARTAWQSAMSSPHDEVRRSAAAALRRFCSRSPLDEEDTSLLAHALRDEDLLVRRLAIGAIGDLAGANPDEARRLLIGTGTEGEWPLINELLQQVRSTGVPHESLSVADVRALLEKIPALRLLDVSNRSYSVSTFLKDVARTHAAEFVNWVVSRLPLGPDVEWADVHLGLEELRRLIDPEDLESSERTRLVDAILHHAKESTGLDAGGLQPLGVLLAWAAPSVDAIVSSVTAILMSATEEEFGRVVWALSELGEPLVFGSPDAMATLYGHARRIGGRSESRLGSVARQAISPGAVRVTGGAVPEYARIADRAAELQGVVADPALRELYREIEVFYRAASDRSGE